MIKGMKVAVISVIVLLMTVLCSACNEFETVQTTITLTCMNNSAESCVIWFTGEKRSEDKLTLPGGSRARNIIVSYMISKVEDVDNSAVTQEETIYVYIYKSDGKELKHAFKAAYGDGNGASVTITFDGEGFSEEITQN